MKFSKKCKKINAKFSLRERKKKNARVAPNFVFFRRNVLFKSIPHYSSLYKLAPEHFAIIDTKNVCVRAGKAFATSGLSDQLSTVLWFYVL